MVTSGRICETGTSGASCWQARWQSTSHCLGVAGRAEESAERIATEPDAATSIQSTPAESGGGTRQRYLPGKVGNSSSPAWPRGQLPARPEPLELAGPQVGAGSWPAESFYRRAPDLFCQRGETSPDCGVAARFVCSTAGYEIGQGDRCRVRPSLPRWSARGLPCSSSSAGGGRTRRLQVQDLGHAGRLLVGRPIQDHRRNGAFGRSVDSTSPTGACAAPPAPARGWRRRPGLGGCGRGSVPAGVYRRRL